ncbi:hypothetical protein NS115_24560, partial [Paenibacillus jamilae]
NIIFTLRTFVLGVTLVGYPAFAGANTETLEEIDSLEEHMLFKEEDIQFERITPRKFEELCFDILLRMGYQSLIWRQGGADQGRDIEGKFIVNNQLVGTIEERWFFECKHYTNGVPVEQISTKIAWADAEGPNHFVLFTSSYLSNSSRQWLEKMQKGRPYKIHIIEGKIIKHLIVNT